MAGLTKKDYQDALAVQSACNLSGVVHDFSSIMTRLWEEAREKGKGTDWVNHHPICILFAEQVMFLAHNGNSTEYFQAHDICLNRTAD